MTSCDEALEAHKKAIIELGIRIAEKASVRDQFAMAAMTGLLAGRTDHFNRVEWAKAAYEIADAMMEARK